LSSIIIIDDRKEKQFFIKDFGCMNREELLIIRSDNKMFVVNFQFRKNKVHLNTLSEKFEESTTKRDEKIFKEI